MRVASGTHVRVEVNVGRIAADLPNDNGLDRRHRWDCATGEKLGERLHRPIVGVNCGGN